MSIHKQVTITLSISQARCLSDILTSDITQRAEIAKRLDPKQAAHQICLWELARKIQASTSIINKVSFALENYRASQIGKKTELPAEFSQSTESRRAG